MMDLFEHGEMMHGFNRVSGFSGFGFIGIIWIIMMLLIIGGGIFVIIYIVKNNNKRREWSTSSSALNILKERFARGEIDEHEYSTKKEVLERENHKR